MGAGGKNIIVSVYDIINKKSSKKIRKTVEFGLETGQTYTMCLTCRSVQKNNHKYKMITAR